MGREKFLARRREFCIGALAEPDRAVAIGVLAFC